MRDRHARLQAHWIALRLIEEMSDAYRCDMLEDCFADHETGGSPLLPELKDVVLTEDDETLIRSEMAAIEANLRKGAAGAKKLLDQRRSS